MGQQQSVVDADAQSYLPWKEAAVACLPERRGFLAQAGAFPNGYDNVETTRPDPKKVAVIIEESPACWDNVFYVLSIGRGTKEGLPSECLASLAAILEGGKATTRWLCEAAMVALARLYAGGKDAVISEIITDVWENHEISNVRDLALMALTMIDYKENLMYCDAMKDIDNIDNKHSVWRFCPRDAVKPPSVIDWSQFDDLLSGHQPMRARAFACLRLKNATAAEVGSEWKQVFGNLVEIVLANVVDDRLVLQAALAAVAAHAKEFEKYDRLKEDMLKATQNIRQMCVFREGRKAAEKVLKVFGDPFTAVFELFPGKLSQVKTRQELKSILQGKFGGKLNSLPVNPMTVLNEDCDGDFERCWEEAIRDQTGKLSETKTKVYSIVMLYQFVLNIEKMEIHHLQMLIASSNMFERYIGLIHIGIAGLSKYSGMVKNVVDNESVSDVRECAQAVMDSFPKSNRKGNSQAAASVDWGSLMKLERLALVRDFPSITKVGTSDDDAAKYLKDNFGL